VSRSRLRGHGGPSGGGIGAVLDERRFESKRDELPRVEISRKSNKRLRVESIHPDHPHHGLYNVFFPSDFDGDKAVLRLNLTGRKSSSMSEDTFEVLRSLLLKQREKLDQFEPCDRRMDPVKRVLWRRDFPTDDGYVSWLFEWEKGR